MQHPEEGLIHAWLDGALPADEAAALESHVTSCETCRPVVAEARGLIAASSRIVGHLDAVPANVIPTEARGLLLKRKTWLRSPWPPAIAASLIIAIGLYSSREAPPGTGSRPGTGSGAPALAPAPENQPGPGTGSNRPAPGTGSRPGTGSEARNEAREAVTPELPPANAASQKATITAPTPTAAALPPSAPLPQRADVQAAEETRATADRLNRSRVSAAVGAVAGGAAGAAAAPSRASMERSFSLLDQASTEATRAFAGCYEMNVSTDILPDRFALVTDSATMPGLLGIRYVDSTGQLSERIVDAGWTMAGGQALVRTARGTILTLSKAGPAVTGDSPNGPRRGRVISCR